MEKGKELLWKIKDKKKNKKDNEQRKKIKKEGIASDVNGRLRQTRAEKGFLGAAQADTDDLEKGHLEGGGGGGGQCSQGAES